MRLRTRAVIGGALAVAVAGGMYMERGNHPYAYELAAQTDNALHGGSFSGLYLNNERLLPQPVTQAALDTVVAQMEQDIPDGHNARNDVIGYCGIAAANGLLNSTTSANGPLVEQIRTEAANYSLERALTNQAPPTLAADCRNLDLQLSGNSFAEYPVQAA